MKKCPTCGASIKGRKDKIYCSLKCKSSAQYDQRLKTEQFYLMVDKQLKTNRKLLKKFNKAGKATIREEDLISEGFDPKYFTHGWRAKNGNLYMFCYEYGFMKTQENGKNKYVLVQWQDYMN
ncbi:hypothetical protein LVD15_11990 [Fulvivirga maritima]|uniref:hypothetical protein n=1 Tax=Fulvivirga maritima TaxID=2904247 RepID=UPI001F34E690|nr:hypothetical protein [Fulvivirga maritima]UII29116.1 hypothetical protein LVD15_11990 [Fulvivirga maritima]